MLATGYSSLIFSSKRKHFCTQACPVTIYVSLHRFIALHMLPSDDLYSPVVRTGQAWPVSRRLLFIQVFTSLASLDGVSRGWRQL
jgi:hypothetical protein